MARHPNVGPEEYWGQDAAIPVTTTIFENEPEYPKVLLYDAKGNPLTTKHRDRRVGFVKCTTQT